MAALAHPLEAAHSAGMPRTSDRRDLRFRRVLALAEQQDGVVSRRQVYAAGVTRWEVRGQLMAGRWQKVGDQSVCVHTGPLTEGGHRWAAVFQGGPRACLDGASALVASGLGRFDVERVRVSVPRGARVRRTRLYDIRQTRRWSADDLASGGVPRTRPAVAAVRAALWAVSDRQAALVLAMTVQQGLATAEQVATELLRVRRDRRRRHLHAVVLDLVGGVRSLGELDVVRGCRERGLPEPDAQVLRRSPNGTYYLDFRWRRWGVVLEVDGIQHSWVEQIVGDALRQNTITLSGDVVLRLPLLGLRVRPDDFFGQVRQALVQAGWSPQDVMRTEPSMPRPA